MVRHAEGHAHVEGSVEEGPVVGGRARDQLEQRIRSSPMRGSDWAVVADIPPSDMRGGGDGCTRAGRVRRGQPVHLPVPLDTNQAGISFSASSSRPARSFTALASTAMVLVNGVVGGA